VHGRVLRVEVKSLAENLIVLDVEEWRLLKKLVHEFFLFLVLVAAESVSLLRARGLERLLHERIGDAALSVIVGSWRAWSAVVLAVEV